MVVPAGRPVVAVKPWPGPGGAEEVMVAADPPVLVRVTWRVSVTPSGTEPNWRAAGATSTDGPLSAAPTMVTVAVGCGGHRPRVAVAQGDGERLVAGRGYWPPGSSPEWWWWHART